MFRSLTLLLAILCFGQSPEATTSTATAQRQRVERGLRTAVRIAEEPVETNTIQVRMARFRVPGASVAVIQDGRIIWAQGYGYRDQEKKLPVDSQTLFEAGSISKPVAAAGALALVDGQKLNLDEDVNSKLKSWKVPENEFTAKEKVTLRRLLSHSAGLTVHGFPGYEAGTPIPTVPQVLDGAKPANTPAVRVDTVPGSKWRYSGGGYTVAQLLVSDVTGLAFPDYMAKAVLKKVGMDHSTYEQPLPVGLEGNASTAYVNAAAVPGKYHSYPEMAAAGLWTTASDLARFGIEIMNSAQDRSSRVLRPETARLMINKQIGTYGLGFNLNGSGASRWFGHGGVDEGFEAMLVCLPESGQGAVVMTNAQGGTALAKEILYSIAAEYNWPGYVPTERTAISLSKEVLETFAGRYASPIGVISVAAVPKGLEFSLRGQTALFRPESATKFFSTEGGLPDFVVERDAAGRVIAFRGGGLLAKRE